MSWVTNDEGFVKNPRVTDSTVKDTTLEKCLISKLQNMRFKPYDEDVRVKNSFTLTAVQCR